MKEPIEIADIRKGDLIRFEYDDKESAHEYRANFKCEMWGDRGQHFLLERPTPPVTLPTEPGMYRAFILNTVESGLWHTDNSAFHYLNTNGKWVDIGWGNATPSDMPLTRLEPVPATAAKFVAAYRAYSTGSNRTVKQLDDAVERVAREEFGVTDA